MAKNINHFSWFYSDDQAPLNQNHSENRKVNLPVHQEEERVADHQQSRLSRSATELHHSPCPPARTFDKMFGAHKFIQITGTSTKAEEPQQCPPSRSCQALDNSTHNHIPRDAFGTGVSRQSSLSRSRYKAEIPQREKSPASSQTKYGANSFRMQQETNGQTASNSDRAEIFLNPGASQQSQSRIRVNTMPYSRPSTNARPLSQITEKPCVQRTKPTRVQGAARFPIQNTEQPSTQQTDQLRPANENQPHPQSTSQPYHSPKEVVQPNRAEHKHLQQTKQSRQQQAERIHIQRMAQNRVKHVVQPHPQPNEQNNQQSAEHARQQYAEQSQPQHKEQQRLPGKYRPQTQAHGQSHPQQVKQLRSLLPEQANDQLLERPSAQHIKQRKDRFADEYLPQPIGDPYRERTDSVHSQSRQQAWPKQSDQTGSQDVEQHRSKRKQPPPTLRPKLSSTSIEVQPPTPQRQRVASSSSPELPTLSSLNVSQIAPEPHTRSIDEVWIDSVNRQNSTTASVLKEAAAKAANQSSHMCRMEHLRHASSFSSMINVGTERRGSWASLKTVVKKASGLMKRMHDPAGRPLGKK